MIYHHYLPMRTSIMHHNCAGTVESVQSSASYEVLFWSVVILIVVYVIYNVINLWRKKWHTRYLEYAEIFKPNKTTAQ